MNITGKALIACELLSEHSECYGLELVDISEGDLGPGNVYVLLRRLSEAGYVDWRREIETGRPGIPKRFYWLTEVGKQALANAKREIARQGGEARCKR